MIVKDVYSSDTNDEALAVSRQVSRNSVDQTPRPSPTVEHLTDAVDVELSSESRERSGRTSAIRERLRALEQARQVSGSDPAEESSANWDEMETQALDLVESLSAGIRKRASEQSDYRSPSFTWNASELGPMDRFPVMSLFDSNEDGELDARDVVDGKRALPSGRPGTEDRGASLVTSTIYQKTLTASEVEMSRPRAFSLDA